jgi:hypothetical protein
VTFASEAAEPIVLPERLDRPARFGPFPSGSDALKFLVVSAVGAVVALRFGAILWTPFLASGLLLALHRPEGQSLDERVVSYARWRWRSGHLRTPTSGAASVRGRAVLALPSGEIVAALETGGIPIAFLPPTDAQRVFDAYRQLLRRTEARVYLEMGRTPIDVRAFLPALEPPQGLEERGARAGYAELVRLLARRRFRRRVRLLLVSPRKFGAPGLSDLESQVASFQELFAGLEIAHRRLAGSELAAAVRTPSTGTGGVR